MDKAEIIKELQSLVIQYSNNKDKTDELAGLNLVDDLGYDSLSLMQLITDIEEKFGISVDDDVMIESFESYNSLLEYLVEKLSR